MEREQSSHSLKPEQLAQNIGLVETEPTHRSIGVRKIMAGIALAATTLTLAAWARFDHSGDYEYYPPTKSTPLVIDNELMVGVWNMHNEAAERAGEIGEVFKKYKLDAMLLQEVSHDDLLRLRISLSEYHLEWVLADAKQEPSQNGYGDVIISSQKAENVMTRTIEGKGLVDTVKDSVVGITKDAFKSYVSLENTRKAMQEHRAAIAGTIKVLHNNQLQDVRLATTHISAQREMHKQQLDAVETFLRDNTSDKLPTLVCGDLNNSPAAAEAAFKRVDGSYEILETGPTTLNGGTPDNCAIHDEQGIIESFEAHVDKRYKTDHYLVVVQAIFSNGNTIGYLQQ